eukprot:4070358-Prymnesium_polylepis.1
MSRSMTPTASAEAPQMKRMLNGAEPTIVPAPTVERVAKMEMALAISSGALQPAARSVAPATFAGMPCLKQRRLSAERDDHPRHHRRSRLLDSVCAPISLRLVAAATRHAFERRRTDSGVVVAGRCSGPRADVTKQRQRRRAYGRVDQGLRRHFAALSGRPWDSGAASERASTLLAAANAITPLASHRN